MLPSNVVFTSDGASLGLICYSDWFFYFIEHHSDSLLQTHLFTAALRSERHRFYSRFSISFVSIWTVFEIPIKADFRWKEKKFCEKIWLLKKFDFTIGKKDFLSSWKWDKLDFLVLAAEPFQSQEMSWRKINISTDSFLWHPTTVSCFAPTPSENTFLNAWR